MLPVHTHYRSFKAAVGAIKVGDGILEEEEEEVEEEEEEAGARCIFGDDAGNVARILPSSRVASYKRKEMLAQLVSRVLMPPVLSVISQY